MSNRSAAETVSRFPGDILTKSQSIFFMHFGWLFTPQEIYQKNRFDEDEDCLDVKVCCFHTPASKHIVYLSQFQLTNIQL